METTETTETPMETQEDLKGRTEDYPLATEGENHLHSEVLDQGLQEDSHMR